ncbi:MAG: pyrimidine-nucleoside phosphorylase [Bacillota bacterium]|nr:MAG: pyrimidine-nucleoside phosphorylase [Bacillota bacterium]
MRVYDIIKAKRDGGELSTEQIEFVITACTKGEIPDYQLSALLMAIFICGMNERETAELTLAIANSGTRIDLNLPKAIDKHSTGGVGDTTTLVVAPIVAACGIPVAKMTGRGLGHTGGTVDKLESIPGLSTELSMEQFINQVNTIGLALMSATTEIAPADKILYALRDVTATVDSIPLIASSIMSKKIASGATHIVLDVKFGIGAFMSSVERAEELAQAMVEIGRRVGRPTVALLTSMDQPLGNAIGNSLEVTEAIQILTGKGGSADLREVCLAVAAQMLKMHYMDLTDSEAICRVEEALNSGAAYAKLKEVVAAQGGNLDRELPQAKHSLVVTSETSGYISYIDALALGTIAITLGAGRVRKEDKLDYAAGLKLLARVGDYVETGAPLITAYSNAPIDQTLHKALHNAYAFSLTKPELPPNVLKIIR